MSPILYAVLILARPQGVLAPGMLAPVCPARRRAEPPAGIHGLADYRPARRRADGVYRAGSRMVSGFIAVRRVA